MPTAHQHGFDVTWPIIRAMYLGPGVAGKDYRKWVGRFDRVVATREFDGLRAAHGLYPFAMTGERLTKYVNKTITHYGQQVKELGLVK